jgi:hypothetical protein
VSTGKEQEYKHNENKKRGNFYRSEHIEIKESIKSPLLSADKQEVACNRRAP